MHFFVIKVSFLSLKIVNNVIKKHFLFLKMLFFRTLMTKNSIIKDINNANVERP